MPLTFLHGAEVIDINDGIRPIQTVATSTIGIIGTANAADPDIFPLNTPVLIPGTTAMLAALGNPGTLKKSLEQVFHYAGAFVVVIRIADTPDVDLLMTRAVGAAGNFTGVHGFLRAETETGIKPKILLAPGLTAQRPENAANPVMAALKGVARKLRATIFADAPDGTNAEAVTWKNDQTEDKSRVYAVAPLVKIWDAATSAFVDRPASPSFAGIQVWLDHNRGFWWSPSNKAMTNIGGTSRPIDVRLDDPSTVANYLNGHGINTVVNLEGWRSWGNRVLSTDTQWLYLPQVRVADAVAESILRSSLTWIDRPLGPALIKDIVESAQRYLDVLVANGAILRGARAWIDPQFNQAVNLALGALRVEYDMEPPAPLEHLIYAQRRNIDHYNLLIQDVIDEITRARALTA